MRAVRLIVQVLLGLLLVTGTGKQLFAQTKYDSLSQRYDSLAKSKKSRYDSVSDRTNHKVDSVQSRINEWLNPNLDDLQNRLAKRQRNSLDSTKGVQRYDSTKSSLAGKIDSLRAAGQPTQHLSRQLDSLKQAGPGKYIQEAKAKTTEWKNKINQPVDNVESKVNEKLTLMQSEGGENANLPGNANIPGVEIGKNLNSSMPKIETPDLGIENPLGKIDNPLEEQMGQVNELKEKTASLQQLPNQQMEKLKSVDEVSNVTDQLGKVNAVTDQVQGLQSDAASMAKGEFGEVKQLPEALESKAKNLEEVKALEKQSGELSKYQDMIGKGNDPNAMKSLAKEQVVKQAKNHFAGREVVLQQAIDKMSKLKMKYPEASSMANITKGVPNAMRGKPLIERLVPGIAIQIQKTQNVLIDFNPSLSYRISGRWDAGLGWNERVGFVKWNKVDKTERIFGPRIYTSVLLFKNFSGKVELEKMNTWVPSQHGRNDVASRQWVWSAWVGLKKDYTFMKSVKGNFQFLYNFYDDHDNSPYSDRFVVRTGFEFPLKKKKQKKG